MPPGELNTEQEQIRLALSRVPGVKLQGRMDTNMHAGIFFSLLSGLT